MKLNTILRNHPICNPYSHLLVILKNAFHPCFVLTSSQTRALFAMSLWSLSFFFFNYSIEVDLRCCANFCNSESDLVIPIYAVFFIFIFFSTVVVTEY